MSAFETANRAIARMEQEHSSQPVAGTIDRAAWERAITRLIRATTNVAIKPTHQDLKDEFVAAGEALDALVAPYLSADGAE